MRFVAIPILLAAALVVATPCAAGDETWSQVADRPLLDCSGAISISCSDVVQGSNVGAPSNVSQYSCSEYTDEAGEVVYEITLPGPDYWIVTVSLDPEGACSLEAFLLGSCDENDCITWGVSALVTDPIPPGDYYLVIDGEYEEDECEYTFVVTCEATEEPEPECCPLLSECVTFDFTTSDGGFYTLACGGAPVWEWGELPGSGPDCNDDLVDHALGTVLDGPYPANAGEAAVIGPVDVTADCSCLEICHFYDIKPVSDGGNIKVSVDRGRSWELVHPARTYDATASAATKCVPQELTFAESYSPVYRDCFDLSAYIGSEILIGFFFGSDASDHWGGWYILWAKLGTDRTPVEAGTWGTIKAMYR